MDKLFLCADKDMPLNYVPALLSDILVHDQTVDLCRIERWRPQLINRENLSGKFREKVKLCLLDAMGAVISGNLKQFQY